MVRKLSAVELWRQLAGWDRRSLAFAGVPEGAPFFIEPHSLAPP